MDQNPPTPIDQQPLQPEPPIAQRPAPVLSKQKMLWIVIAAVVVVIAGAVGIWLWATTAVASYDKSFPSYKERTQKAYDGLNQQPPDTNAYRTFLQQNSAAFKTVIESAPKQPVIFGITLGSNDTKKQVDELTAAAQKTQEAMEQYLAFIVYRDSLLEIIKDNTGKVSTIEDLRTFKAKIEANNKKLEALKPPKGLEAYAQEKVQIYKDILADLAGAVTAYDAKKSDEYTKHILKLAEDAKRTSVQKAASELLANHTYYEAFIKAAQDLEALLKK